MVVQGDFQVELVDAHNRRPFKEHFWFPQNYNNNNDNVKGNNNTTTTTTSTTTMTTGASYFEVEPNAEFLIRIKKIGTDHQYYFNDDKNKHKHNINNNNDNDSRMIMVRPLVDNQGLGWRKTYLTDKVDRTYTYFGLFQRVTNKRGTTKVTTKALQFARPGLLREQDDDDEDDGDNMQVADKQLSADGIAATVDMMGTVQIQIYESHFVGDREEPTTNTKNSSTQRKKRKKSTMATNPAAYDTPQKQKRRRQEQTPSTPPVPTVITTTNTTTTRRSGATATTAPMTSATKRKNGYNSSSGGSSSCTGSVVDDWQMQKVTGEEFRTTGMKCLRSKPGSTTFGDKISSKRHRAGRLLETITIKYSSLPGLMYSGIVPMPADLYRTNDILRNFKEQDVLRRRRRHYTKPQQQQQPKEKQQQQLKEKQQQQQKQEDQQQQLSYRRYRLAEQRRKLQQKKMMQKRVKAASALAPSSMRVTKIVEIDDRVVSKSTVSYDLFDMMEGEEEEEENEVVDNTTSKRTKKKVRMASTTPEEMLF